MRSKRRWRVIQAKTMLSPMYFRMGISMRSMLAQPRGNTAHRLGILARAVMVGVTMMVVVVMVALRAVI